MNNEYYILICSLLAFALIYFIIKCSFLSDDNDFLEILLESERWFHYTYHDLWKIERLKVAREQQHRETNETILKDVQENERAYFRIAVWLYDWIWCMTHDTEKELFSDRSLKVFYRVCENEYRKQLESVQKYHEEKVEGE